MVGPGGGASGFSSTDFVNSGSYFLTVFVLISGITTFTGLAGGAGFFGGGILISSGFLASIFFASGFFSSFFGITGCLTSVFLMGVFAECVGFACVGLARTWVPCFAAAGLTGFFGDLSGDFLAIGLAAFLGVTFDFEWDAVFAAGFLAVAVFFAGVLFLAGFAAFFLVAILSGFF